ncbi:DUF2946 domain-containing protein [Bradyrhizobium ontarionense]|uniref:DUF2946 domain-containing protein n=1 Tax=Bradyrhizobium ontarionense TaxID=2898149 RepID=A0ABY3R7F5_9BRAD|nr:DUF2946 domain-containing protein [Bradyrhizobium sp. A19]UFZ02707.1 DUF2946 domain-containing protein [Bradyrhizobium sp. A19]
MSGQYDTSINESRGERRRTLAALFCMVAVALNLVGALTLPFRSAPLELTAAVLDHGWTIICSAGGMTVLDADGHRVPDDQTGQAGPASEHCVFCLPLMHGNVALAPAIEIPVPAQFVLADPASRPASMPVVRLSAFGAWPRAPPVLQIG